MPSKPKNPKIRKDMKRTIPEKIKNAQLRTAKYMTGRGGKNSVQVLPKGAVPSKKPSRRSKGAKRR